MSTFYGDIYSWFVGIVTEAGDCDPLGLGRVKVRCDGVHGTNIKNSDLPLAQCALPTTGGGTSGVGENPRLEAGARVCGYFIDGNACQLPLIIGSIPHIGLPSSRQLDNQVTSNEATFTSIRPTSRSFVIDASIETTVVGDSRTNPEIAWDFFSTYPGLNFTYENHQIAGMIGNFMVESFNFRVVPQVVMDPTVLGDDGAALGIAQWRNARREALLNYAATRSGLDPLALITQLRFVDWELANDPAKRTVFFMTEDVDQATMMFMRLYEKPEVLTGISKNINNPSSHKPFGYPHHYWDIRAGENERLENARAIYNSETQTTSGGDDA